MSHGFPYSAGDEQEAKPAHSAEDIGLLWGLRIPMRDGVRLGATVYKPTVDMPVPAIFTLTPYIADSYHERAIYFSQRGYAFVLVDCRGRGNSEGAFEPFVNEEQDGHDVVLWLGDQPWCNGSVAMWGGSYAGFNQWMTLKAAPRQLKTIVPVAAAHAAVDFPFFKNLFSSYEMRWLTLTSGSTGNSNLFGEEAFWIAKYREMYLKNRPFSELDRIVGNLTTHFQTWLQHPTPDPYWDRMSLAPADYDAIKVPILTITGHYDGDQTGALHYYNRHMQSSSTARDCHFVIIGPWDHAGTRTPKVEFGGLTFGQASLVDMNQLHRAWYDWTLRGGDRPEFLQDRVAYYVMGAEQWKYAAGLEAIATESLRLYLKSADGQANDAFHSGTLEEKMPGACHPDHYAYDPLDTRPAELETEEVKDYLTDQRYALRLFGNGLVYHSHPFPCDTEISGTLKLVVWVAIDVRDTDFQAVVSEITADGGHIILTRDLMRARYRDSLRRAQLVTPGEINCYQFTGFTFFSRRLAKGSRLRLVFSSPNSIHLQKNYNSGGIVSEESATDARTAHVTLYHDQDHPSYLELPIVHRSG